MTPGVFLVVPVAGFTWPALVPVVAATAAALGYKVLTESKGWLRGRITGQLENLRRESLSLDAVLTEVIAEDVGREERMQFQKEDLLLVFRRDGRGKFHIDVVGTRDHTALDLRTRGEEFARDLIRRFAYHKLTEQLERRGATVVAEEVEENGRIRLRLRQWH